MLPSVLMENIASLVIHVSLSCEEEMTRLLKPLSPMETESMIRLGTHAITLVRDTMNVTTDQTEHMKKVFETQLQYKDQEKTLMETMFRENTKMLVECGVSERCEQLHKQLKYAETRTEQLLQERTTTYDEIETRLNEERIKIRFEQEQRYNGLQVQYASLLERFMENEQVSLKRLDEERTKIRYEQEQEKKQLHQEFLNSQQTWMETKLECTSLQEKLTSLELQSEMEISRQLTQAMEKYHQQENTKIINLQEELQNTKDKLSEALLINDDKRTQEVKAVLDEQKRQLTVLSMELNEMKETKHASSSIGKVGETTFCEIAQKTFCTFEGYEITDTSKIPHSGDFRLQFQDMNVLVDVKNFKKTSKISTTDISKLFHDMTRNQSIRVAWMVSLTGYIARYNTRQYVCDVVDGRLYVFVNDLLSHPDPEKLLQEVWYVSSIICKQLMRADTSNETVTNCRKYESRMKTHITKLQKSSKKSMTTLQQQASILQQMKEDLLESENILRDMMNDDLSAVLDEHSVMVKEWWDMHMVQTEGAKIKTNALYSEFHKTTASALTVDMFKMILKSFLSENEVIVGKQEKSQYTMVGYALKPV